MHYAYLQPIWKKADKIGKKWTPLSIRTPILSVSNFQSEPPLPLSKYSPNSQ